VDDGIHVVSATRRLMRKGEPAPEAAWLAVRMKFKAIACTSAILAVFLGLLMLTSFPPVAHFGLLSACGLVSAFLGAVFALPALLSWMR
jgi:predicted RND superfamily exporter protein